MPRIVLVRIAARNRADFLTKLREAMLALHILRPGTTRPPENLPG